MNKLLLTLLVFALCACSSGDSTTTKKVGYLFGDSVSANGGVCSELTNCPVYPDSGVELSKLTKTNITSLATGGETTNNAISGDPVSYNSEVIPLKHIAFADWLEANRPDFIIIRYGAADAVLLGIQDNTYKNIKTMLSLTATYGIKTYVVGINEFSYNQVYKFNALVLNGRIADAAGQSFIDVRGLPYTDSDTPDGIHPTKDYSDRLNEVIAARINFDLNK